MKIAFLSPSWPYGQNGIVSYTRSISRALHDLGAEISILTFHASGSLGYETVVPLEMAKPSFLSRLAGSFRRRAGHELPGDSPVGRAIADAVRDLAKRGRIDLLETEESFGWGGYVTETTSVPVVVRLHGPYFLTGVYDEAPGVTLDARRLRDEGRAFARVMAITAPSRQVLEAMRAHYGLAREARVIPNPIAIDDSQAAWSLEHCDRDAILFVGRTDNRKGGDLVIRAFAELARSRPRLKLHFVGPDKGFIDSNPGEAIGDYLARTVEPGIRERIIVHGALDPADIAKLRMAARVTVMASRYENFPMAALEALAVGCPLVTTGAGGIPELVTDEETGLICDGDVAGDMAGKLARLLDDDTLSVRLGRAGRQACIDRFHPMIVAREMLTVYASLLAKHAA